MKESARAMLLASKLLNSFWSYTLPFAATAINVATKAYGHVHRDRAQIAMEKILVPFGSLATVVKETSNMQNGFKLGAVSLAGAIVGYAAPDLYIVATPSIEQPIKCERVKMFVLVRY